MLFQWFITGTAWSGQQVLYWALHLLLSAPACYGLSVGYIHGGRVYTVEGRRLINDSGVEWSFGTPRFWEAALQPGNQGDRGIFREFAVPYVIRVQELSWRISQGHLWTTEDLSGYYYRVPLADLPLLDVSNPNWKEDIKKKYKVNDLSVAAIHQGGLAPVMERIASLQVRYGGALAVIPRQDLYFDLLPTDPGSMDLYLLTDKKLTRFHGRPSPKNGWLALPGKNARRSRRASKSRSSHTVIRTRPTL